MKNTIFSLLFFNLLIGCKTITISESTRKEIIAELDEIKTNDQKFAKLPPNELIEKYGHEKAWEIFTIKRDSISEINQNAIKTLYNKFGYLGYKEVGEKSSQNFWITIQHADNDVEFQQKMLKELKKQIAKKNASKIEYAMLEDRVNVNLNKKQRFGTQVTYNEFGQAIPKNGLIDSINIENLRKEYDLPTFQEYYNQMTTSYFEMNKQILLKNGIKQPKLYK